MHNSRINKNKKESLINNIKSSDFYKIYNETSKYVPSFSNSIVADPRISQTSKYIPPFPNSTINRKFVQSSRNTNNRGYRLNIFGGIDTYFKFKIVFERILYCLQLIPYDKLKLSRNLVEYRVQEFGNIFLQILENKDVMLNMDINQNYNDMAKLSYLFYKFSMFIGHICKSIIPGLTEQEMIMLDSYSYFFGDIGKMIKNNITYDEYSKTKKCILLK